MNIPESFRVALRGLAANKMRTLLTMLGVIIGVGVVIVVVAIGEGAKQRVTDAVNSLGTNLLTVRSGAARVRLTAAARSATNATPTSSTAPIAIGPTAHLTLEDASLIAHRFAKTVEAVAPLARDDDLPIRLGSADSKSDIFGSTTDYPVVNNATMKYGRFFTDAEVDAGARVCVIGNTIVDKLTADPDTDMTGMDIEIRGQYFHVIGTLEPKGAGAWGQDQDDQILIPITTAMRRVFHQSYINQIGVRCRSQQTMPVVVEQISNLLRTRHHVPPPYPDNDDFNIRNQTELMERQQAVTGTMTSLLSAVAVISLVIGGVGIMNIMLVSVTERTREIGIRKAIGATGRDIMVQFLIESAIISLLGGIIGIALGIGTSAIMGELGGWAMRVNPAAVSAALITSAAVGLFFGIYPASKAARLHPIEALRFE